MKGWIAPNPPPRQGGVFRMDLASVMDGTSPNAR
jgi:hypothetical protein